MATRVTAGITGGIALFVLGGLFGVNGEQWGWWQWAAWAGGAVALVAAVSPPKLAPRPALGCALSGATIVAASTAVMAGGYSDPYHGPLFWPHALAVLAFVGVAALVGGVAAWRG